MKLKYGAAFAGPPRSGNEIAAERRCIVVPLDKKIIGERIKALRKTNGLRQWQVAELLCATQPAIHKYENGILPEVKRLLELARIGNTSIEWILTGRHWENGATGMDRLDPSIYELAHQLQSLSEEDRTILSEALDIISSAVGSVRDRAGASPQEMGDVELARVLKSFESRTRETLAAALAVCDAVVTTLSSSKVRELHSFGQGADDEFRRDTRRVPPIEKNAG